MRKAGGVFLGAFVVGGTAVAWLAAARHPMAALWPGIATLLVHWRLSNTGGDEAEQADASYFLGFLLTLVLLAAGLLWLAAATGGVPRALPPGAGPSQSPATGLFGVLCDLVVVLLL